jgi:hypothetical protein
MKRVIFRAVILSSLAVARLAGAQAQINDAESRRRIVIVAASYSSAETPPGGAIQGARIVHVDGTPFTSLLEALTADPIAKVLGPAIIKARNTWAGAFVDATVLGQIVGFQDWQGALDQWEDLLSQNRVPSPPGAPPGFELLSPGDVLVLGPFNDCIHTLSGTKPLCFTNHQPNNALAAFFNRMTEVVQRAQARGMVVYVPGFPNPASVDLSITLRVLLPPGTELIDPADYQAFSDAYARHFRGLPGMVYIPTDDIPAAHIGDGMHLKRPYYTEVARRIMTHFAQSRGYSLERIRQANHAQSLCYFNGACK